MTSTQTFAGRQLERLGWLALMLTVMAVAVDLAMMLITRSVDGVLHSFPEFNEFVSSADRRNSRLIGIELVVVPLSAIAAAWLRPGAERIRALRETQVGPYLPALWSAPRWPPAWPR